MKAVLSVHLSEEGQTDATEKSSKNGRKSVSGPDADILWPEADCLANSDFKTLLLLSGNNISS